MTEATNGAGGHSARSKPARWLWISLIASLSVNFIVIGAVGGAMWSFHKRGGPSPEGSLSRFADRIPGERGEEIRKLLRESRGNRGEGWHEIRQARAAVFEAFLAEPIDRTRLESALAALDGQQERGRRSWGPLILQLAEKLTPQERRDLAEAMRRGERRFRHRDRERN